MTTAAPPPPQPPSQGSSKTLLASRKTLIAAIVIIVAVAVVAVGVYLATRGGGGGTTMGIAGATSLRYTVRVTQGGVATTYTYMAKSIGTSNLMIRVEMATTSGDFIYIINGAQKKAWAYSNGVWQDLSVMFSSQWDTWNSAWEGYTDSLEEWTGVGEWTYTAPDGSSIRIYDIAVNPSLADSLFQH